MTFSEGQIISTKVGERWQSTQFWDSTHAVWVNIPPGSLGLVVNVSEKYVKFISCGRLLRIDNCYDDHAGTPIWCDILNKFDGEA